MKLIILDRDGVVNRESRDFIKNPDEWIPIPENIEAIARLTKAGYTIVLATNQSGLARGYFTLETFQAIGAKLHATVEAAGGKITKIYYCPHGPNDNCTCRKPKPGMFEQIEQDFKVKLKDIKPVFAGDSLRDIELGLATGCKTYLVAGTYGDGQHTLQELSPEQRQHITVINNLNELADELIAKNQSCVACKL